MNEIFKKKSAILYAISQNKIKKNKNFSPLIDKISPINHQNDDSPRISSIRNKLKANENYLSKKLNSRISLSNKLNDLSNSSKINTILKNSYFKQRNINKVINNYFPKENELISNYSQNNEKNKLFENNNKLMKFQKEKLKITTQIIQKKIRYHDLDAQTRKKSPNFYTPLLTRNNKNNNEKNNEDKTEDDPYITVYGVLFSNDNKSNIKYLKKEPNNLNIANSNSRQNKLWKNNKNLLSLSLPWLVKNQNNRKRNKNFNLFSEKSDISKSKERMSYFNDNEMSKIKKRIEEKLDIKNNNKFKKMMCYDMTSIAGSDHGRIKVNQDNYFSISKLDNCEEIKIFGIFDGHGDSGDIISKEIRDFFEDYFLNLFNNKIEGKKEKNENDFNTQNYLINAINNYKNINQYIYQNMKSAKNFREKIKNESFNNYNFTNKYLNKKIKLNIFEDKNFNFKNSIKSKIKSEKIKKIYNQLSENNYSQIFSSYSKINEILHKKYSSNNICHLSGSTSLLLFIINSENCNKIITTNLGDSKIISISEDKKIKELNIVHTPNNPDEKKRIINNGGEIRRIDYSNIGPLRIWYKNKKYPGLSITRSFGDFESDDLGVISEPEIKEYDIDEEKIKIIIFGTDGVWKFLTNDKIMDIALPYYEQNDVNGAVNKISETAIKLWEVKNPKGIADVTVYVIFFK